MIIVYNASERLKNKEMCDTCEHKSNVRCEKCGCFLRLLQTVKSFGCPEGKF
jgi:protein-arginine kinase activator protein McsA